MKKIISYIMIVVIFCSGLISTTGCNFFKTVSCDSLEVKKTIEEIYFQENAKKLPKDINVSLNYIITEFDEGNTQLCKASLDVDISNEKVSKYLEYFKSDVIEDEAIKNYMKKNREGWDPDAYKISLVRAFAKAQFEIDFKNAIESGPSNELIKYKITITDDGEMFLVEIIENLDKESKTAKLIQTINLMGEASLL